MIRLGTGRRTRNKTGSSSSSSGSSRSGSAAKSAAAAATAGGGSGPDRLVCCLVVGDGDEVVVASRNGVLVRQSVDSIPVQVRKREGRQGEGEQGEEAGRGRVTCASQTKYVRMGGFLHHYQLQGA